MRILKARISIFHHATSRKPRWVIQQSIAMVASHPCRIVPFSRYGMKALEIGQVITLRQSERKIHESDRLSESEELLSKFFVTRGRRVGGSGFSRFLSHRNVNRFNLAMKTINYMEVTLDVRHDWFFFFFFATFFLRKG